MNTLVIVLIAACCLVAGYVFYGRWLANKWGIDPKAKTPAVTKNDGQDYVPTDSWVVFAHQFSSIAGAVVGLVVAHSTMNLPAYTGFHNEKSGDLFPILFVTVACGAVFGFHSLVSSGTSSKTISNEKDMPKVGFGAMLLESLLAVLALCVSALALTSLDSVARIGRMSFQELFSTDDMKHAEGWRKVLCNKYFSTVITLACGYILTQIGYSNIWPLFGSANQLLSALVLITLCVFLRVTGRENRTLFVPLVIMLCVTFTALVERSIALVKAYSAGTAVFMVEGLQLIIAILLMVLGLIIVVHSGKVLFKKSSEK